MAVRVSASGEDLRIASTNGAKTVMGWFRIGVNRSVYSTFLSYTDYTGIFVGFNGSRNLETWVGSNQVGTSGPTLTVGQWYNVAMTIDGTGANGTIVVYIDGVSTDTSTAVNWAAGSDTLYFGNDALTEWLDGRCAYLKVWDAALTADEILDEMTVTKANRTDNLLVDAWTQDGGTERARDYSGNGNDLTETGTLSDEDNPPIDDIGGYAWLVPPVVAGSGRTATLANTLANFTSASAAQVLVQGTSTRTLANFTSSASAAVSLQASGANTLAAFTSSSAAEVLVQGTATNTLADFTSAAVASTSRTATLANTLSAFTSSGSAVVAITGTAANILAPFVSTATATSGGSRTATLANTLASFTSSSSSEVLIEATLANTLAPFISLGNIVSGGRTASLSNTLSAFTSASVARVAIAASLVITLAPFDSLATVIRTDPYTPAETPIEFVTGLAIGSLPIVETFDDVYDELLEVHNAIDLSVTEINANNAAAAAEVSAIHARLNTLDSAIVALQDALAALP